MAYDKPNHTQTPNLFFDKHLPNIKSLAELKVTLTIFRGTFGWHEKEVELTVPRMIGATGMSRQSVIDGIQLALKRETIKRRKSGRTFAYEANVTTVKKVDRSENGAVKILDQKVDCSADPSLYVLNKEINREYIPRSRRGKTKPPEEKYLYPPANFPITEAMWISLAERQIVFPEGRVLKLTDQWRISRNKKPQCRKRALANWQSDWLGYMVTTWEKQAEREALNGNGAVRHGNNGLPNVKITTPEELARMLGPSKR